MTKHTGHGTPLQAAIIQIHELLQEKGKRPLFLVISGSHANGLQRPDSDIDVRGIYLEPTRNILAMHSGRDTVEGTIGLIDYQCYELKKFFNLLNNNNGNMVRMLLNPLSHYIWPDIKWRELGFKYLTKSLRNYYIGYAHAQRKRCISERGGKALIYTYREIFEGMHVMSLGLIEYDFKRLWKWVVKQGYYNGGLLDTYFLEPHQEVTKKGWEQFYAEWESLCTTFDSIVAKSYLPDKYDGYEELNNILYQFRTEILD